MPAISITVCPETQQKQDTEPGNWRLTPIQPRRSHQGEAKQMIEKKRHRDTETETETDTERQRQEQRERERTLVMLDLQTSGLQN